MGFFAKLLNTFFEQTDNEVSLPAEKYYKGVKLSELNAIAEECRHDGYVTAYQERLVFYYKSGRGHQTEHAEYIVQNGKLHKMTYGGYPGQVFFPDVKFMNIVNERFNFE